MHALKALERAEAEEPTGAAILPSGSCHWPTLESQFGDLAVAKVSMFRERFMVGCLRKAFIRCKWRLARALLLRSVPKPRGLGVEGLGFRGLGFRV